MKNGQNQKEPTSNEFRVSENMLAGAKFNEKKQPPETYDVEAEEAARKPVITKTESDPETEPKTES